MADDPVMQSQLLQLWTMLTTNPDLFVGTTPVDWNATADQQQNAAQPIVDALKPYIDSVNSPILVELIGKTLIRGNPDSPEPGTWEMMKYTRQIYQTYSQMFWSGGTPHPGGNELATFFNENLVSNPASEE
ncbi:hypothetical protein ACFPT7_22005 [Acidicapsa dinghuensis]|uniref:Uncharacterized protein n=1 Tax=Acidicapsa dinghuensis TaxID=2218256 RepID=A0ABW1ENM7_9BACT|nr:hypothetical protein [Acidicapsa dinghuensis]